MPLITVDVDVGLDEFSIDDLLKELESRGFNVPAEPNEDYNLDKYELDWLIELLDDAAQRTYAYDVVRDKLRKQRYG